jgi:hypothetical protein
VPFGTRSRMFMKYLGQAKTIRCGKSPRHISE